MFDFLSVYIKKILKKDRSYEYLKKLFIDFPLRNTRIKKIV